MGRKMEDNKGKCLLCEKEFTKGWNDFFCGEMHAMIFRRNLDRKTNQQIIKDVIGGNDD